MSFTFPPLPSGVAAFQQVQIVDGTWRSICLRCFVTAGNAFTRKELDAQEREHVCSSNWYPSPSAGSGGSKSGVRKQ